MDAPRSLATRVAFRFGVVLAGLIIFPFPLGSLPKTETLAAWVTKPIEWVLLWFATHVLGTDEPAVVTTGSGDTLFGWTQMLLFAIVAAIAAAVWSAIDERRGRRAYPRLAEGATVVVRYALGYILLTYAFAKLSQFPPPGPGRLEQRVGDMSPMGMLWTFMGSSQPYSLFGGFAEGLGGVLLFWRRTAVAGALVAIAAMTNVVVLNLCYDVPVKLFSMQLLLAAIVIVLPHAPRLIAAVLGRATPEVPPRPRRSQRWERARLGVKVVLLLGFAYSLYEQVSDTLERTAKPPHELEAIWVVEKFVLDGTERPPLATDPERWRKLVLGVRGGVRLMTGEYKRMPNAIHDATHTITVKPTPETEELWRYTVSRAEDGTVTLVVDATHKGKPLHVEAKREPDPLLVTRGFHWINEVPYNR